MKKILIIGSGWLSWPLAQQLQQQGHRVIATTTNVDKAQQLNSTLLPVIQLIAQQKLAPDLINKLENHEVMIISIPPQRDENNYFYQLEQLLKLGKAINIQHILFISSSSVYGDSTGKISEISPTKAVTTSAIDMVKFEHLVLDNQSKNSVLRLSGLINSIRHPGRFLAGKTTVINPESVVNMIHQQDCIGLIKSIIMQNSWGKVHLGCAPSHPTRRQFYQMAAEQLTLIPPQFENFGGRESKLIDSSATATWLKYQYQYPNLMKWLATDPKQQ